MRMVRISLFGPMEIEPEFYELPNVQQAAVMAHEEGHKRLRHLWVQLLYVFASDARRSALLHAQEFEADAYAKARGHGSALANVLRRSPAPACHTHPATKERIARLIA
jgi:Zn-dependent protease with chaperone function